MSIIGSNILAGASGQAGGGGAYEIQRSLRFNSSDSAYLSKNFGSSGNRKTWTLSFWWKNTVKSTGLQRPIFVAQEASPQKDYFTKLVTGDSNTLSFNSRNGGADTFNLVTTQVFRDPSAWYHIVLQVDTTQATASNRLRLYVNGTQVTTFSTATYPSQNLDIAYINESGASHFLGRYLDNTYEYLDSYLAECFFIDGQALDPTSFGEFDTNGVWQPKAFSGGSYGTTGFRLPFSDNSTAAALGTDTSSNGNTWTVNNISVTAGAGNDSLVDSPSQIADQTDTGVGGEVVGNYATLNPLSAGPNAVLANGNLDWSTTQTGSFLAQSTIAMPSGKWYCEYTATLGNNMVGIQRVSGTVATTYVGGNADSWGYYANGNKYNNNSGTSYGASYTTGDVVGIALDVDAGTLTFYKNGASQGQAYSGLTNGPYTFVTGNGAGVSGTFNFGQRSFAYTAPSGFKALTTTNLPEPTIADGSTAMDVALYTGNFGSKTISGLNLSPDLVWIKTRGPYSGDHNLYDAVRGTGNRLRSNTTDQEDAYGGLTAFNSNGFTLEAKGAVNGSGETYVAWTWDAGSSTVTNTQGSITSQVRANASAGFSVVTYTVGSNTSQTIGHGLGVAPQLLLVKERNQANNWQVYHASLGNGNFLYLNGTNASAANNLWNNTSPTSTVFSIRSGGSANFYDGKDQVCYAFAPVAGYSSFGSYTGNGSTDGPFVYIGFRPRWVMVRRTDTSTGAIWAIWDTARNTYNILGRALIANNANAEQSAYNAFDILSNGLKLRDADGSWNGSGGTYIYYAVAENPFQYARAR
jgi:hypothetical protein